MDRATKRKGMRLGMEKLAQGYPVAMRAALHPLEQARNMARYNLGQRRLLQEYGYGPGEGMQAMENEAYYQKLRELYDKHVTPMQQPAAEKPTKVLSVSE